jgi:hypothetical protein
MHQPEIEQYGTALRAVKEWAATKFRGRDPANMDAMLTEMCRAISLLSYQVEILSKDISKLERVADPPQDDPSQLELDGFQKE